MRIPQKYDLAAAKIKASKFCAIQERCHQEVDTKLKSWGLPYEHRLLVISFLVEHNFLSEERFVRAFARGKFRLKQWGRLKISYELQQKNINKKLIATGLSEIDEKDYAETALALMDKKSKAIADISRHTRSVKISNYMVSKGYEYDIIAKLIKEID